MATNLNPLDASSGYPISQSSSTMQSNTTWGGVVQTVSVPFVWEGWVQLLPFGDVDLPIFCSRCRDGLAYATQIMGRTFYSPRTGDNAKLLVCPSFNASNPHDAWILP